MVLPKDLDLEYLCTHTTLVCAKTTARNGYVDLENDSMQIQECKQGFNVLVHTDRETKTLP